MTSPAHEAKRGMVKKLLDMLKANASEEVSNGLKKPEGLASDADKGIQTERIEDLPDHKMDHSTPEHEIITKELSEGGVAYNKGGVVEDVNADKYDRKPAPPLPMESENGQPDIEGSAHEEAVEPEEERLSEGDIEPLHPAFSTFMTKKKKK